MLMKRIAAQNWLNQIPNEVKLKVKSIGRNPAGETEKYWELKSDEVLEGELKIDGFPELKLVDFKTQSDSGDKGLLTKVTITNCPKLENINIRNNKINDLDVSGLGNLIYLLASHNELGKVNVEGCVNLQIALTFNTEETKQKWTGLEDLGSLKYINAGTDFVPVQKLKNLKIIIDPSNGLSDILNSDGTINEDKLKEYKEAKNRPTQEQLDQAVANEKDKYKNFIDPENLEDEAKKKGMVSAEEYNKLLKNQKPEGLPDNWKAQLDKIAELEKRPTQEDYDKLKILKDTTVANYNKLVLDKNTIQAELTKVKADLAKWNSKFPNQTPEQIEAEIKKLKQSAAVITPEQQHKINDYDRLKTEKEVLERRRNAVLGALRARITKVEYTAFVEANNKIN